MPEFKSGLPRNLLCSLGLGFGLLVTAASGCLGLAGNTSFSLQNHWQLSFPSSSLLQPGENWPSEPKLTGCFLLNGEGEWLLANGGRLVIADTVQLRLDGDGTELSNRLNELYFSLPPLANAFVDLGKQVVRAGAGYFLHPAGLWPEEASLRQDRESPPEGKVLIRGEYLFPCLTLEVGWAPKLEWEEKEDGFLRKCLGSPQPAFLTWTRVSGSLGSIDTSGLLAYSGKWRAGISLAKVWGDRLETHGEMGWEEQGKGDFKGLAGGHYTFAGGENLLVEYYFNGAGLTRQEWEKMRQALEAGAVPAPETPVDPHGTAGLPKAGAFLTEAGFPGLLRHYVLARFSKELRPAFSLEEIVLQNLVDGSGLVIINLHSEKDFLSLVFGVQLPYGKQASEFGLPGGRQVKLQVNVGF